MEFSLDVLEVAGGVPVNPQECGPGVNLEKAVVDAGSFVTANRKPLILPCVLKFRPVRTAAHASRASSTWMESRAELAAHPFDFPAMESYVRSIIYLNRFRSWEVRKAHGT